MTTALIFPKSKPVVFENAPISLVVCQVRFEHLGVIDDARHAALREGFGERYPLAQKLQNSEVAIGPGGASPVATVEGLRFASVDGKWTCSLLPDFVSLETSDYRDWADFEARLREVLAVLQAVVKPRVETRLGLRYVNELSLEAVTKPSDWLNFLQSPLVADLAAEHPFAESLATRHSVLQLDAGDGARLHFRHGLAGESAGAEDHNLTYILDFDCFRQKERLLDIDEMLVEADRFNTLITSAFQWCLTDALWKELKPNGK
ncbi:MAG: TIGR04255 family protein [Gaiellaceae bacterium]